MQIRTYQNCRIVTNGALVLFDLRSKSDYFLIRCKSAILRSFLNFPIVLIDMNIEVKKTVNAEETKLNADNTKQNNRREQYVRFLVGLDSTR
ncbi:hypothetical protein T01_11375 [Trichinella spiralis]|uniref:Uncharacterized protein n=1 Tax=Trichinella spiralis TaxID=6334 RepID=A0A0V1BLN9_TRISP|nr:hypothetical protein T01_11375 [Trichinella spiralis]